MKWNRAFFALGLALALCAYVEYHLFLMTFNQLWYSSAVLNGFLSFIGFFIGTLVWELETPMEAKR